ncbi:hypothetical protein MASR2M78_20740 [Treponema sp.]
MTMNKRQLTLDEQLIEEQNVVSEVIEFYQTDRDFKKIIYDDWTAQDVLGHITSWHMSFERNLLSAVQKEKPKPFSGTLTDVNEREVKKMAQYSIPELLAAIKKAQETIDLNIKNSEVTEIAYKRGSRNYSPLEHLEIVQRHLRTHLKDLQAKY